MSKLEKERASVWFEAIFASAFIVYLGRQAESVRNYYRDTWVELLKRYGCNTILFDFNKFLDADRKHLYWCKWGLPCDDLCLQNAAIISSNKRKVQYSNE